jgi:hypothetical protein
MHLLIPFASALSDAASFVLRDLSLPHLCRTLIRLTPARLDEADEYSLSPPHDRALAAVWGWQGADGAWPFAALAASVDGVAMRDLAWGLLTPVHWHVGRDHISLADPLALKLDENESRALFEAMRHLFETEGFTLAWGAPLRWYAAHASFEALPCASLDRVIGRNVDLWLPNHLQARLIRRLQNEVQMLLYPHPINEAREARGELSVNSFWLSGCGRYQPANMAAVQVDDSLRAPLLAQDWAGWADAWRALDAGAVAQLLSRAQHGESVSLTLCGERGAQSFESALRSLWQRLGSRWKAVEPHVVLQAL